MTMPRLRQLVIAARSLKTADQLAEVLGLGEPFIDTGVEEFGLVNRVFPIGDQFLEVVVPTTQKAPAARFIERGGEGGYMAIFQTEDLTAARTRIDKLGVRRVWNVDLEDIAASHLHPADVGGAIVSIDEARPAASWRWAGPGWQKRAKPGALRGAVLAGPDPEGMAAHWADILEVPKGRRYLRVADEAGIEFRQGPEERLIQFQIAVKEPRAALQRARGMNLCVVDKVVKVAGVALELETL